MVEEWTPPPPRTSWSNAKGKSTGPLAGEEGTEDEPLDELLETSQAGEEAPTAEKTDPKVEGPEKHPWHQRILPDLPLLIVGVVCFVCSFFFFSHGAGLGNRVYPVWVLFVALGSIATTGGVVSVYVGPDPPTLDRSEIDLSEFVVLPREEWDRTREELTQLRARLGIPGPEEASSDLAGLGVVDDAAHRTLLSQVEGLSGGDSAPAPFTRAGVSATLPPRTAARLPSLLPSAIVGPTPTEGTNGSSVPSPSPFGVPPLPTPPPAAPTQPTRTPVAAPRPSPAGPEGRAAPSVEVPPVPSSAPADAIQKELDRQIRSVMGAPTPPAPTPAVPPARALLSEDQLAKKFGPKPTGPTYPPQEIPEGPAPPEKPSGTEESFTEEAEESPAPRGDIEDLAKKFGALVSPTGFFPSGAAAPTPTPRPKPAPNTWSLPNLRGLRPWPGSGRFEWEMAALRISIDYCIPRAEGEEPEAFMDRAELLLQQGVAIPAAERLELDRAFAVCASLMQAYRHLTSKEIETFSAQVRPELERIGQDIGFPLRAGDDILTYAQQMRGVLAVFEKTGVKPVGTLPPSPPPGGDSDAGGERPSDSNGIDAELDRLVSEVDKDLPAGSAPASRKKKSS